MTAPITPDERAAMRGEAETLDDMMLGGEHVSRTEQRYREHVPRLLDALDTAEAEVARLRGPHPCCEHCPEDPVHDVAPDEHEVPCPSCEADSLLGRARRERDEARDEVARLREEAARPAPVWDEDTVTEAVARAMFPHYFTDDRQPLRVFTETRSDAELREAERESARHRARQALAVVREHAPVRPDREEVALTLCKEQDSTEHMEQTDDAPCSRCLAWADAVLALWPGESRATVQAEALRDAADEYEARLPDGTGNGRAYNSYTVAAMLRARADRLEKGADRG